MMENDGSRPWFGASGLNVSRGGTPVLHNIDLHIDRGVIHALVGMHNAGKSTLCQALSGSAVPDSGVLFVAGAKQASVSAKTARAAGIIRITGEPQVFPRLTAMENLIAGRENWWLGLSSRKRYEQRVREWLSQNDIKLPLTVPLGELPREYRIVVALLTALFRGPALLILDEVLEEISVDWQKAVLGIIRRRVAAGMSVVLVTQKIEDVFTVADTVTAMRHGRVILTERIDNVERFSLVRLCYDQLDTLDETFAARESFQELVRYTKAMLDDLPSAVVVLDRELRVRFVNRSARVLLFTGKTGTEEVFLHETNRLIRESMQAVAAGGEPRELSAIPLDEARKTHLVDARVHPVRENGTMVGCMVVIDDVSLRESLRNRVMLSDRLAATGLLAAGVAHEVNNPLEIIGNYLTFLDGETLSSGGRKAVEKMEVEVGHIQRIISNLVAYSGKKSAGVPVNPVTLMRELVELLDAHMRPRNIHIDCNEPDGELFLAVDHNELRQIFINLLRNSLDAMPDNGVITFEVARDANPDMVRMRFTDTGGGIGLENPNDIFLPFVTTKKKDGVHQGLGLYVVYGIIESYGGAIEAENPPGGGCRFTIRLPLTTAKERVQ